MQKATNKIESKSERARMRVRGNKREREREKGQKNVENCMKNEMHLTYLQAKQNALK